MSRTLPFRVRPDRRRGGHAIGALMRVAAARTLVRSGVLARSMFAACDPILVACVLGLLYVAASTLLPPGGVFTGDQGVKFLQVDGLASGGGLGLGSTASALSVLRPLFAGNFYRAVGAEYQAVFSPAYALTVLPFYVALGRFGLLVPSMVGAVLAGYASARIGSLVRVPYPGVLAAVVGLASPFVFYAVVLWEHALSAGLLTVASYLAMRRRFFGAGVVCAVATWLRPEAYLYFPALALALLCWAEAHARAKATLKLAGGFLFGAAPWWSYNLATTGAVLGLQVEANGTRALDPDVIALFLVPARHKQWLFVLALVVLALLVARLRGHRLAPVVDLLLLGAAGIGSIGAVRGDVDSSVTDVFPVGLVAILSIPALSREPGTRFLWVLVGAFTAGVVLTAPTWGGGGWGPRMLLGVYPPLAVLAWQGFWSTRRSSARFTAAALLAITCVVQGVGLRSLYREEERWARLNQELLSLEPRVVATSIWWLPQVAAPTLGQMSWYGITDEQQLDGVASLEGHFWWIWTREDPSTTEDPSLRAPARVRLTQAGILPPSRFEALAVRELSARGLHATLYEPIP